MSTLAVAGLRRNGTVYHFHDPELIPAGLALRLLGKRVIYDAHEDLPRDILFKNWIPRRLRGPVSRLAAALEWIAGHALSGIVATTLPSPDCFTTAAPPSSRTLRALVSSQ
jgi:hypothetical protein